MFKSANTKTPKQETIMFRLRMHKKTQSRSTISRMKLSCTKNQLMILHPRVAAEFLYWKSVFFIARSSFRFFSSNFLASFKSWLRPCGHFNKTHLTMCWMRFGKLFALFRPLYENSRRQLRTYKSCQTASTMLIRHVQIRLTDLETAAMVLTAEAVSSYSN